MADNIDHQREAEDHAESALAMIAFATDDETPETRRPVYAALANAYATLALAARTADATEWRTKNAGAVEESIERFRVCLEERPIT